VDVVRLFGGGMVRSVRAMTGIWDPSRKVEGAWCAYLEFEDGVPATLVYNGYGHLDTAEFFWWVGEGGTPRDPELNLKTRKALAESGDEVLLKESMRYAGSNEGRGAHRDPGERHQPFFGLTLVSCQRGDLRQSPDGLYLYGDEGKQEISLAGEPSEQEAVIEELYQAVARERRPWHDGRWGEATVEVCAAILASARDRTRYSALAMPLTKKMPKPRIAVVTWMASQYDRRAATSGAVSA
jgi:phthalate 4,5-cis-dihydrodiol dehydrogenase